MPGQAKPKSTDILKLTTLCHIRVKVQAYKSHNDLTKYYNCQQFGHIWVNCKEPPRCLWCGRGNLRKECSEKNENSTHKCCNCCLKEGEHSYPSTLGCCKHAKGELQRRKTQKTSHKKTRRRKFSSSYVVPGQSFPAVLRSNSAQHPQPRPAELMLPYFVDERQMSQMSPPLRQQQQQNSPNNTGQSVQAAYVNSSPMGIFFKVVTVVEQFMTVLNGAVSEEEKIMANT